MVEFYVAILNFALFFFIMLGGALLNDYKYYSLFCLIIGFVCDLALLLILFNPIEPKAIDVYRHKTELKITYEGEVPVDTIVIFKKR